MLGKNNCCPVYLKYIDENLQMIAIYFKTIYKLSKTYKCCIY